MAGSMTRAALREICEQITDGTHDSPKLQPCGVPFIKGKHIFGGRIDFGNCDFISEQDHAQAIRRAKPQMGDILLCNIGSIGDAAFVNTNVEFSIKNVALLRADRNKISSRYLYYHVTSRQFQDEITSKRSGVAQPFIALETIRDHEITFHSSLTIQRRIERILSAYDDLIENNLRRIAILEEMAQAIYREWFVEFKYPGYCLVKTEGPTQCDMPMGWVEATVGDIAEEARQSVDPCKLDPATPYVGLAHIPRRSIALCDWGRAHEAQSTKLYFQKGDILFGKIRPYFHKVAVAPVDGVCSSDTIVIRPTKPEYYSLVLCCVSSDEFVGYSVQTSQGTKMPRANWKVMRAFPIAIPSVSLLKRFNDVIGNLVDLICNLVLSTRALRLTRDLLLPRLISGELDVNDIT